MRHSYVARIVNLINEDIQQPRSVTVEHAHTLLRSDNPEDVMKIQGSFALLVRDGQRVRMARSLNQPMRYFLAKEAAGPMLVLSLIHI